MKSAALKFTMVMLAALGAANCADSTPEIFILENSVLDDDCELSVQTGSQRTFRSRGTMDVSLSGGYELFPLVMNNLAESQSVQFSSGRGGGRGGLTGTNFEASLITLTRAEVSFEDISERDFLGAATPAREDLEIPISGSMEPGGKMAASLQIIGPSLVNVMRENAGLIGGEVADFLVTVKFFGVTSAGNEVDSNEFIYPLQICFGCLVGLPTGVNTCLVAPEDEIDTPIPCLPGQDEAVDCRYVCGSAEAQRIFDICSM